MKRRNILIVVLVLSIILNVLLLIKQSQVDDRFISSDEELHNTLLKLEDENLNLLEKNDRLMTEIKNKQNIIDNYFEENQTYLYKDNVMKFYMDSYKSTIEQLSENNFVYPFNEDSNILEGLRSLLDYVENKSQHKIDMYTKGLGVEVHDVVELQSFVDTNYVYCYELESEIEENGVISYLINVDFLCREIDQITGETIPQSISGSKYFLIEVEGEKTIIRILD